MPNFGVNTLPASGQRNMRTRNNSFDTGSFGPIKQIYASNDSNQHNRQKNRKSENYLNPVRKFVSN